METVLILLGIAAVLLLGLHTMWKLDRALECLRLCGPHAGMGDVAEPGSETEPPSQKGVFAPSQDGSSISGTGG